MPIRAALLAVLAAVPVFAGRETEQGAATVVGKDKGVYGEAGAVPTWLTPGGGFVASNFPAEVMETIRHPQNGLSAAESFHQFFLSTPFLQELDANGHPRLNERGQPMVNRAAIELVQCVGNPACQAGVQTGPGNQQPAAATTGNVAETAVAPSVNMSAGQLLIQAAPYDPAGYSLLGDAYSGQGKPERAVTSYTDAISRRDSPDLRSKRGFAAEKAGDHELANADALAVLKFDPDNRAAHSLYMLTRGKLSSVHLIGGQSEAGEAQAGAPGAAAAGGAGQTSEQVAAEMNVAIAQEAASGASSRLLGQANAALAAGDPDAALRLTDAVLRSDPRNAVARYVRANAFLKKGDTAGALREASAGLELAPGNGPLLYTQTVAYGRQRLWEEAVRSAEAAVRANPRAGYAYQARAGVAWGQARRADMMRDLRTAASLDRRFQADLARASQTPTDVDPTLLFGSAAPAGAPATAAPAGGGRRLGLWLFCAGAGALFLIPVLWAPARQRVTTVLRLGSPPAEAPAQGEGELPPSAFWRRYEVTREIGAGGMGIVYEAWDRNLERRVAVKRMRDEIKNDRRERERFLQEARTVAQLRHPNLVEIYSIEEDGPDAYLVFEFVEGRTLHDLVAEKGRLAPAEARDLLKGVCAGLDYAHRRGIVHRDLKPANVIVSPDGAVKVMDFGVARQAQDALQRQSMTNTVIGTPPYMAPEQEQGVVCAQGDVYALGVCLYELLSGALPFQGTAGAVLLAKLAGRYEPLAKQVSGLPPALGRLIDRALEPKPEARIQSAAEFWRELDAAVSGVHAA